MGKLLAIVGGVVAAALVTGAVYLFLMREAPTEYSIPGGTVQYPPGYTSTVQPTTGAGSVPENGSGQATATMVDIKGAGGTILRVRDFTQHADTVKDTSNPGYYYLGYHTPYASDDEKAVTDPPYLILFIESDHYFNISLLKEPIAETRTQAEQYLLGQLGVTEAELCLLNYMVSVPNRVNSFYASPNLGFSFYPGATTF